MLELSNLSKRFGRVQVLDGVEFRLDKPGITAVLGPNGSGKTTILKSILGMVLLDSGTISVDGKAISNSAEYRKRIGYLPQIARFPDNLTVRELIGMIAEIRAVPSRQQELIDKLGIEKHLNKKLGHLSGGTRQKVNLVLTFMFDNDIYILDEPTAGLDPVAMMVLRELIREESEKGKQFLITTHIMSLVDELADEVLFLLEGKIYFRGTPAELKSGTETQSIEEAIAKLLTHHA
jgi:Cu-processing system ATP-binding protein